MEKGKTERRTGVRSKIAMGLLVLGFIAAGCSATGTMEPTPQVEPSITQPTYTIICSSSEEINPNAILVMLITPGQPAKDGTLHWEVNMRRLSGNSNTKPNAAGGLNPFTDENGRDLLPSGIDYEFPVAEATDPNGNKSIVYQNLNQCVVPEGDREELQKIFNTNKTPPKQVGFNGIPSRFSITVANPRSNNNPFKGIQNSYSQSRG